jgi:hypothetical protein
MKTYLRSFLIALALNAAFALAPAVLFVTTPNEAEADGAALVFAMRAVTPVLALVATGVAMALAALVVGFALRKVTREAGLRPTVWSIVWLQMLAGLIVALALMTIGFAPASELASPVVLGLIQLVTAPLGALPFVEWRRKASPERMVA